MSSAAGATFQDRTLNKVAVCSAVFAGFAYVGYSYARTAFCRKLSRRQGGFNDDSQEVSRVVLRRLSQTTQTDASLGNIDDNTGGRLIIRPKSVQARIRELNLRARQFSDTFVAIQNNGGATGPGVSRTHAMHTHQSLQCSPWSSPKLLSPVDIRGLTTSYSTENISQLPSHTSPTRPKWVRRSLRRKKLRSDVTPPPSYDEDEQMEVEIGETEVERRHRMERETREMYSSNKDQLIERLQTLTDRGRLLSPFEAKTLVALLCAEDTGLLERTLVTIANCATFTLNVDLLRESGCIVRLCGLLQQPDDRIKLAAIQTLGNVLLAEDSIMQAQSCLDPLIDNVNNNPDDPLCLASLVVLTNVATIAIWHHIFCPHINRLYELVKVQQQQVQLQSLRLLVNLSCNKEMIPHLLAAQGPGQLCTMVSVSTDRSILLRILTLLATLSTHVAENKLCPISGLPTEYKAPAPLTISESDDFLKRCELHHLFTQMLGVCSRDTLIVESNNIGKYHPDPEVRRQAVRLHTALGAYEN